MEVNTTQVDLLDALQKNLICPPDRISVLCQHYQGEYLITVSIKPFSYIPFIPKITNPLDNEFPLVDLGQVYMGFTRIIFKLESDSLTQNDIDMALALLSEKGVYTHEHIGEQRRLQDPHERARVEYEEKARWYQTPVGKRDLRNELRQTLKELNASIDEDRGILSEIRTEFRKRVVEWLDEIGWNDESH